MDRFLEFLIYLQGPVPYIVAFLVLLACGLGVPVPEDVTLFAMGLLSYYGLVDLTTSIIVCLVGVLVGDIMIFWFGRKYGTRLLQRPSVARFLHAERMGRVKEMFHRYGNKVIFAARFMPGLRAPTYFTAGSLHLPFRVFLFYDGLAAVLSVPILVGVVYYFGDHVDWVIQTARRVQNGIVLLILAIVALFIAKQWFAKKRELSRTTTKELP